MRRYRELNPDKRWVCERCSRPLPTRGPVWRLRYRNWAPLADGKSGLYCDSCVDLEQGVAFYPRY